MVNDGVYFYWLDMVRGVGHRLPAVDSRQLSTHIYLACITTACSFLHNNTLHSSPHRILIHSPHLASNFYRLISIFVSCHKMPLTPIKPSERIDSWRQRVPSRLERRDPFEGDGFEERPSTRLVSFCQPSVLPYCSRISIRPSVRHLPLRVVHQPASASSAPPRLSLGALPPQSLAAHPRV